MNIADLIDQAKQAAGIDSDSAFSKYLGLSRTAVGNWRSGVSLPDTVSCERLAGLTGQPLAKVIGMIGEARAHSREEKAVWRKLAGTTAMLLCAIGFSGAMPGKAYAHSVSMSADNPGNGGNAYYVKIRLGMVVASATAMVGIEIASAHARQGGFASMLHQPTDAGTACMSCPTR